MKKRKVICAVLFAVFLTVCGAISIQINKPSFEIIKANKPPVVYTPELLKINLNTATEKELAELDGIGKKMAERIVSYRKEKGGFTEISQLMEISGMGEKKLDAIREKVTLE